MTNAKPRTLADALKKIAVLKREVEATRKRLVRERDGESQRADAAETCRDAAQLTGVSALEELDRMEADLDAARRERDEALDALDAVQAKIVENDAPNP